MYSAVQLMKTSELVLLYARPSELADAMAGDEDDIPFENSIENLSAAVAVVGMRMAAELDLRIPVPK